MRINNKVKIVIIAAGSIIIAIILYKNFNVKSNTVEMIQNKKSSYDASREINDALLLFNSSNKAKEISDIPISSNIIALSFEGLSNKENMEKVVELLNTYNIKATFFIPGIKAAEDTRIIKIIDRNGHDIENGTLSESKKMEKLSKQELVTDFCKTNKILESITGKAPTLLKCNSTVYSDNVLAAAYASGNRHVVNIKHYISYQSFKNYDEAYAYINNLPKGTIISIKLDGVLDNFEYGKKKLEEKPAIDKKAGLDESNEHEEEVTILMVVEWLLKAIDEQKRTTVKVAELPSIKEYDKLYRSKIALNKKNYENNKLANSEWEKSVNLIYFKELIERNNKKFAPVVSEFFTTQKSLSYTFRGLSNEASLERVLEVLKDFNAKGTFFVTKDEILKYPERINKILSFGHEIGNGGITTSSDILNKSTAEICTEIYEVDKLLRERGITTNAYMPGYGYVNSKVQEAIATLNNLSSFKKYELFTYSKAPITQKYKDMNAKEIVDDYFNINSYVSLKKGEIVYFRLDSDLFKANDVVASIIQILTKNYVENGYTYRYDKDLKNYLLTQKPLGYSVETLRNLQGTVETATGLGRYKVIANPPSIKKIPYEEALELMKTNYIGNKSVDLSDFNQEENLLMDRAGTIDTNGEGTIFLTFDDWGGDTIINEIIDVLNKHNVKAGFFVISKYVDRNNNLTNANPNLLRTIAINGHDIGSHNYNHELLEASREELEISLIKSYDVLAQIIGDTNSLRPYFRPPTLLLRREGLAAVFESGYKYSISGNISTHDYESDSAQAIVKVIEEGLVKGKGNIVVMHMNNHSFFTAEALDIFLTNNEMGLYGEKYKFAKLSDYLESTFNTE